MMRYLPVTILCLFGSLACEKEKVPQMEAVYIAFYERNQIEDGIRAALSDGGKSHEEKKVLVRSLTEDVLKQYAVPPSNIVRIYVFSGNSPGFAVSLTEKQAKGLSVDRRIARLEKDREAITIQER